MAKCYGVRMNRCGTFHVKHDIPLDSPLGFYLYTKMVKLEFKMAAVNLCKFKPKSNSDDHIIRI